MTETMAGRSAGETARLVTVGVACAAEALIAAFLIFRLVVVLTGGGYAFSDVGLVAVGAAYFALNAVLPIWAFRYRSGSRGGSKLLAASVIAFLASLAAIMFAGFSPNPGPGGWAASTLFAAPTLAASALCIAAARKSVQGSGRTAREMSALSAGILLLAATAAMVAAFGYAALQQRQGCDLCGLDVLGAVVSVLFYPVPALIAALLIVSARQQLEVMGDARSSRRMHAD